MTKNCHIFLKLLRALTILPKLSEILLEFFHFFKEFTYALALVTLFGELPILKAALFNSIRLNTVPSIFLQFTCFAFFFVFDFFL